MADDAALRASRDTDPNHFPGRDGHLRQHRPAPAEQRLLVRLEPLRVPPLAQGARAARSATGSATSGSIFINAWNEWAEAAVLEPTDRHGRSYLLALRDVAFS